VLGFAAVLAVYCQSSPAPNDSIPDWVLYNGLFKHVWVQEKFGDELDAKGKDSTFVWSHIRNDAGLTDDEDAALKRIAKDRDAAHRAYLAQRTKLMASLRASAAGGKTDPNVLAQLKTLEVQETAMNADHIAQLKSAMGPQSIDARNPNAVVFKYTVNGAPLAAERLHEHLQPT
jgi:hypothetical protein